MIIQKNSTFHPDFHVDPPNSLANDEIGIFDEPCRHDHHPHIPVCRQLPGTLLRLYIPAGATLNILNLLELTSPSGICFIIRLPFLGGDAGGAGISDMDSLFDAVNRVGGRVEFVE